MSLNRYSYSAACFSQIPLPTGEGAPSRDGRPGEGDSNEDSWKHFEELNVVPLTRPADADHPLPSGEGFAGNISQFGQGQPLI